MNIPLYKCGSCGKAINHPVALYEDDETYCQECADRFEARGEMMWEAQQEEEAVESAQLV